MLIFVKQIYLELMIILVIMKIVFAEDASLHTDETRWCDVSSDVVSNTSANK